MVSILLIYWKLNILLKTIYRFTCLKLQTSSIQKILTIKIKPVRNIKLNSFYSNGFKVT